MNETTPFPEESPRRQNYWSEENISINDPPLETRYFEIAGFWRRFFAFALDVSILAIPLNILGFVFRDITFALGPWGRLIGYGIIFFYWSYFNSSLHKGQTIGKKLMKIAVVDSNGAYLAVSQFDLGLANGEMGLESTESVEDWRKQLQ
jgi:hypothetical protein